MAASRN